MTHANRTGGAGPIPEQLAAYADGELGPADRAAVEAWLHDHPDARADVEAQRRLRRLSRDAAPPEPDEAAWAGVLARVEAGVAAGRQEASGRPWTLVLRVVAGLAAVAAVLLLAVALTHPPQPKPTAPPVVEHREAPLPVASAEDVEILSMEGGDVGALVVGEPPVQGPLTLASADEVTVDNSGHDVQIVRPTPEPHPGSHSRHEAPPMFIMPTDVSQQKTP